MNQVHFRFGYYTTRHLYLIVSYKGRDFKYGFDRVTHDFSEIGAFPAKKGIAGTSYVKSELERLGMIDHLEALIYMRIL